MSTQTRYITSTRRPPNNNTFVISKWLTISDSKSTDDYVKEAYDASKTEIDKWASDIANIGKTFNPDSGKIEESQDS